MANPLRFSGGFSVTGNKEVGWYQVWSVTSKSFFQLNSTAVLVLETGLSTVGQGELDLDVGTVHSAAVTESQPRVRDDRYRRKVRGTRQEEVALQRLSQGHSRTTSETLHNQTLSPSKTEFVRQTNSQKTPRNWFLRKLSVKFLESFQDLGQG